MSKAHRFRPRNNRPRCEETGLVRYRDRKDAKLAIRAMHMIQATALLAGGTAKPVPVRSFRCSFCGGAHTTRQPLAARVAQAVSA